MSTSTPPYRVLLTGGGGFLGTHILDLFATNSTSQSLPSWELVVLDSIPGPRTRAGEAEVKRLGGIVTRWVVGSILNKDDVRNAMDGVNLVLHLASVVDSGMGNAKTIMKVNVEGTRTVLDVALDTPSCVGVVYSSSIDVVTFGNWMGVDGLNEDTAKRSIDMGFAEHHAYTLSKTMAEKMVLAANMQRSNFRTCAIRPVGIYGERSIYHIEIPLRAARDAGAMNLFSIGNGGAVFQMVYAGNLAWMHVLAGMDLLRGKDGKSAGHAFMGIDNTKVVNYFKFQEPYLTALGYQIPSYRIPAEFVYCLACMAAFARKILPKFLAPQHPIFTDSAVHGTCVSQWFLTNKAELFLGYKPIFTPMQARKRTLDYFLHHMKEELPMRKFTTVTSSPPYDDMGIDYTPDDVLYLENKGKPGVQMWKVKWMLCGTALTTAAIVVIGVRGWWRRDNLVG